MIWLTGIGCLALGIFLGVIFSRRSGENTTRIKELESQIIAIEERHEQYKGDVSEHFGVTSELVQQLTKSYRDVYQHLAMGAQDLCTTEVANRMLPVGADAVFDAAAPREEAIGFTPPKDYAAKADPDQKGALSEDFGLEKTRPEEPEPADTIGESVDKGKPQIETAAQAAPGRSEPEPEAAVESEPEPVSETKSEPEQDTDQKKNEEKN